MACTTPPPLYPPFHHHHHHRDRHPTSPTLALLASATTSTAIPPVHAHLIKTATITNNFYLSKLLALYIRHRHLDRARLLLQHHPNPNTLSWNTVIKAHVAQSLHHHAILLAKGLIGSGVRPDSYTLPSLLKACTSLDLAMSSHVLVIKLGLHANLHVVNTMLDTYSSFERPDLALQVFEEIPNKDIVSYTTMMSAHARSADVTNAVTIFQSMPEKDKVAWGAMLTCLARNGHHDATLEFFHDMQSNNVQPTEVSIVNALTSCGYLGLRGIGMWLHCHVIRHAMPLTCFLGTSLLNMYSNCGDLDSARAVFDLVGDKNVATWNAMIGGLATNGRAREALGVFEEMVREGVEVSDLTLSSVLSACRHGGLVEEGLGLLDEFGERHGVVLNLDHYGCVVDMLGRAGRVDQAYELIKSMPMEPNEVIWGALLGACKTCGHLELAEEVLEHLIEVDPENAGNYVLVSNMYARRERWEDVERVRADMRRQEAEKTPGSSTVEVDGLVHEFFAGDQTHPWAHRVYEMLEDLYLEMKHTHGYRPTLI